MGTNAFPAIPKNSGAVPSRLTSADQIPTDELMIGLLELSRDCIKILGIDGTLDFINCGGLDAFGTRVFAEVQGRVWWTLWPEHTQDMVRQAFERARDGKDVEFSAECPTVKGNLRRWVVNLKPMTTNDGTVVGVLCKSRDLDDEGLESPEA